MAFTKVTMTGGSRDNISEGFTKVNDLIDDLLSTDNGLGASQIGLEDSAGNWTAEDLESFATEASAAITSASGLTNVLNEKDATTTGLTWGYYGGNIRVDSTVTAVTAGTILLTDDATNYLELDTSGTLSKTTTGFTAGKFPVRQIVCASGAQTTSTDKRAFIHIIQDATTAVKGKVELATDAEAIARSSAAVVLLPSNLAEAFKVKDYIKVSIEFSSNGVTSTADPAEEYTSTNGKVFARTFAHDSTEDVIFAVEVPEDIVAASGVKFKVHCLVTAATGPSNEGVAFLLSGYSIGNGDALNGTFGTQVASTATARTDAQYDRFTTTLSGTVTITNLAAGELMMLKLERDHDHASDDYGQLIGVTGITLEIVRYLAP